ncbi:signal-induced proliferation-associated 1-like protein 2 [Watersipora subatra]|uniref:signal-induced proliferation-associated 1-like protein 2 n=1 Tax=Watersipora subatra TaxID=2589382 RepID=UPI00355B3B91
MATQDSRHYYEHPNHSSKERLCESDYFINTKEMNGGLSGSDSTRSGHPDNSNDSFYRAKLREGFVDLRNSYHQKFNQRGPRLNNQAPNASYASQPALQPRSRHTEGSRPLSMHASEYRNTYDSVREQDYGTSSSRHSADSHPSPTPPLFRSNSDLHLDNNAQAYQQPLRKDFGSADLVEPKHAGYGDSADAQFFDMLRSYKSDHADQRAPAPPGIQSVLRGESETSPNNTHSTQSEQSQLQVQLYQPRPPAQPHYMTPQGVPKPSHMVNAQPCPPASTPPLNSSQLASSPPSHQSLDLAKRSPKSSRKGQRPRSGDVSALLRKLRPMKSDGAAGRLESANDTQITGLLSEVLPEERTRKKAFVHYDCQSVGINFVEAALRRQNSNVGNTKTGASAASHAEDAAEDSSNYSSGKNRSFLVCQCPAFVNELGNERERDVVLSLTTAQRRYQPGGKNGRESPIELHRSAICNGLSILDGLPGADNRQSLVEKHRGVYVLEYRDRGCTYYRQHFRHSEHQNYCGIDENVGPVAISIKREKASASTRLPDLAGKGENSQNSKINSESAAPLQQYRVIVRTSELKVLRGIILEDALPAASRLSNSSRGLPAKDIIEYVAPEIQISCLKQAMNDEKTKDRILALDEQGRSDSYKVGIMYCKAGQSTEEEMYNNENASLAFTQFLDLIGRKVELKGFQNFKGGLDNKTDTTGAYSYYTTCQAHQIMFHVSTLLPFENNRQQLLRKRHIGNDIVTVVFQEPGSLPFDVTSMRSQFQHVFIIVQVQEPNTDHTSYSVAVTRSKDVPSFGPAITRSSYPHGPEFADFLIAKILNAENASYLSEKFQAMAVRTRGQYMEDLASSHVTGNSLDSSSKLGKFSLSGKKKDKKISKTVPDVLSRGGIVWPAQLEDYGLSCLFDVYLIISADVIAIMEMDTLEIVFSCWCSSVIGWTNCQSNDSGPGLKVYINQGNCIYVKPIDNEDTLEIMERLRIVTLGCETEEMVLKRNAHGQLGFHVHMEGIVSDVEPMGHAWKAGLRTGSRLVEICKVAMITLTHEQMIELLRTSSTVSVSVIAALDDGKPRRSLEEKERSSDYYTLYQTDDSRQHLPTAVPRHQPFQHQNIDGEESSAYFSDDEASPQSTVMSIAKRVNTVTLRSSSSGGSSCSPGSTLSGKHKHPEKRARSDTDHDRRHVSKSQEQRYSEPESISQRRPPAGPVYTPPPLQYAPSAAPYYQSTPLVNGLNTSSPESTQKNRQRKESRGTTAVASSKRGVQRHKSWAAKDWRHVEPPSTRNYQPYTGEDTRQQLSGRMKRYRSQEILARQSAPNHPGDSLAERNSGTSGHYSKFGGAHFNKGLQRTLSDESLRMAAAQTHSNQGNHSRNGSYDITMIRPIGKPRTGSFPPDDADEDSDWNRLVSTASKAINSEKSSTNRSQDSSTDIENSSLLSGSSTPTLDKARDMEKRCSRLEHELQTEKRKSRDLERRLQLEKNRSEDLRLEVEELRKQNSSLRSYQAKRKSLNSDFEDGFLCAYDGPESVM